MTPVAALPELLSLAAVAFVLGMRHGVDADHLAAIDALTRCNTEARPATARRTGLWFSLGHGAIVVAVALLVALSARTWVVPDWLVPFGAWASIAMLTVLGALNLIAWHRTSPHAAVTLTGWRSRLFNRALRACRPAGVAGVGALFALSFDTLSQAALMAVSGAAHRSLPEVAGLSCAFAFGMILVDGLNGWWVARLIQNPGQDAVAASRVMCVAVSGISLGTAALGAAAQVSAGVAGWAEAHSGWLALSIVAIVGASFLAGLALVRREAPLTIA